MASKINEWTEGLLVELVVTIVDDVDRNARVAESIRQVSDAAFLEELARLPLGKHTVSGTQKLQLLQSYSSGHGLAALVATGGIGLSIVAAPIAIAAGVGLGGFMAFNTTRIRSKPPMKTIGIKMKTRMPTYGLLACPRKWTGRTKSQEKPAVVTSATPSMLIQLDVRSRSTGRLGLSFMLLYLFARLILIFLLETRIGCSAVVKYPISSETSKSQRRTELQLIQRRRQSL